MYQGATWARYVSTGNLLVLHKQTLFAVPFRPDRLEISGTPTPMLEGVTQAIGGRALFDSSLAGTAMYQSGGAAGGAFTLQWLDGEGKT